MKSTAISKTFRLLPEANSFIEDFAKKNKLSITGSLHQLLKHANQFLMERQLEKELKELSDNEKWMKENKEWANLDLNS